MSDEKTRERLLAQRNALHKPAFVVKETAFKASIKPRWRRPTGKHSPVRQYHKGRVRMPHPGYGAPALVKGLLKNGKKPVLIHGIKDLESVDLKTDSVIIASNVGLRKRLSLLKICSEKGFTVVSIKDINEKISNYEKMFNTRKEANLANKKAKQNKVKSAKKEDKKADEKKADEKKTDVKKGEAEVKKEDIKVAGTKKAQGTPVVKEAEVMKGATESEDKTR